jgi:glutamate--cysteine ligase
MARRARAYGKKARQTAAKARRKHKKKSDVSQGFEKRFGSLAAERQDVVTGGLKGVEKESLRVDAGGCLSQASHPMELGSALSNRYITTDFSEALLEFVTPTFRSTWETLRFLCDIHQFTYQRLDREMLWAASMPCRLDDNRPIPLARYGTSNVGRMKTIYRRGLGLRYGRNMQTIAGVHFNYSLPEAFWPVYRQIVGYRGDDDEFRSEQYFALLRNFRRFGWIVLYLFGASPAMCKSFAGVTNLDMPELSPDTLYEPYGTSLRMSDLGYSNRNQSRINISLNNLDAYVRDLSTAIRTPEPDYQELGVKADGEYRQLSANRLQIENEYYSPIRPKRVAMSGERPTAALQRGGVEYVEIRSLDISTNDPAGINQNTMRFMEAFLVYCLVEDSPKFNAAAIDETKNNQAGMAKHGRDPEFRLRRDGVAVSVKDWASEILDKVAAVATLIDRGEKGASYSEALQQMRKIVAIPEETPSARLLEELRASRRSFFDYAISVAQGHREYFAAITSLAAEREAEFEREVSASLQRQRETEASDEITFDEYLAAYFATG